MREINHLDELTALIGQPVGQSEWITVTQERIQQFADATGDHQWIHLDTERAKTESPYGTTIAHGFLTLSLLSQMMATAVRFKLNSKLTINYGLNRVRFISGVPAGSQLRGHVTLQQLEAIPGGQQCTWQITVEIANAEKPACVAEWVTRIYF